MNKRPLGRQLKSGQDVETDANDGAELSTTSHFLGTAVLVVRPSSSTTSVAGTTTNVGARTQNRNQVKKRHDHARAYD